METCGLIKQDNDRLIKEYIVLGELDHIFKIDDTRGGIQNNVLSTHCQTMGNVNKEITTTYYLVFTIGSI